MNSFMNICYFVSSIIYEQNASKIVKIRLQKMSKSKVASFFPGHAVFISYILPGGCCTALELA